MQVDLYPHQLKAVKELHNGAILKGGVGTGKSRTALAYYFTKVAKGSFRCNGVGDTRALQIPKDIYILTTAKKRDKKEWEGDAARFSLGSVREDSFCGVKVTVDSWNNIPKYQDIKDAFFIFDEQRLVGSGAWVKAMLKIAKHNEWIVLSATPGDNWMDYIPVFIANGFYKNRTEFIERHVIFKTFVKFPQIKGFMDEDHLYVLREKVIVDMPFETHTKRHVLNTIVSYDKEKFDRVVNDRWHVYKERPLKDIGEMFLVMRQVVNESPDRLDNVLKILERHPRLIIFYNFNYELEALRELGTKHGFKCAEWNGQKHEDTPTGDSWVYLVQYTAGAEGWNCITTDATIFYSLNYSYKINEQAKGRIDRMDTEYTDLYYFILRSNSAIDRAIAKSLATKENFNEKTMAKQFGTFDDPPSRFDRKYEELPLKEAS